MGFLSKQKRLIKIDREEDISLESNMQFYAFECPLEKPICKAGIYSFMWISCGIYIVMISV